MAINQLGCKCRGGQAAAGKASIGRKSKNKIAVLGLSKQTGVQQAGCRSQPSVRRRRTEWEIINDDEELEHSLKRRR